jgi:ABC-2 type transport system ATP-binding protein
VESGSLPELRHLTRTTVTVVTARPADRIDGMPGVHGAAVRDGALRFDVDTEHLDAVIGYLHGLGIRSLVCQPPTLEQLFLRHYGDDTPASATRGAR